MPKKPRPENDTLTPDEAGEVALLENLLDCIVDAESATSSLSAAIGDFLNRHACEQVKMLYEGMGEQLSDALNKPAFDRWEEVNRIRNHFFYGGEGNE